MEVHPGPLDVSIVMTWIDCRESIPDTDRLVLVWWVFSPAIGRLIGGDEGDVSSHRWMTSDGQLPERGDISHWAELPEAPGMNR